MLIIFEGPDGAGKSTLITHVQKALHRHYDRYCVLINPKAAPIKDPLIEYKVGLNFYMAQGTRDLLLDRSWLSEDVYGPIWRDGPLEWWMRGELDNWAFAHGALLVLLDEDDATLTERVEAEDPLELVTTGEMVTKIAAAYRQLDLANWDARDSVLRFSTSKEDFYHMTNKIINKARALDART